jgi:GGDEF domain-containing protein
VIGTLTLYDKVAPDQFFAGSFGEDDLQIFTRYASYVERAIENAHYHAVTSQHRNFDEETGLPNADYLARRIDQEVARAVSRSGALTLVTCRLENLEELRRSGDPRRADQIVLRTAESLRNHLRDFDVLARTAERDFAALLPDPGPAPEERVTSLARAVAEDLAQDESLAEGERLELAFGYAIHPADGRDRQELLSAAAVARIRMV